MFIYQRVKKNVPNFTINRWYVYHSQSWVVYDIVLPPLKLYKHDIWYTYIRNMFVCTCVCVVQPRDMLPMNMFIPSLHVMNLNVNDYCYFQGEKG